MFSFSALPASRLGAVWGLLELLVRTFARLHSAAQRVIGHVVFRGHNLGTTNNGNEEKDFFISVDPADLPLERATKMLLQPGQAEFHDAFILHHSDENKSNR